MNSLLTETIFHTPDEVRQLVASVLYGARRVHLLFADGATDSTMASYDDDSDTVAVSLDVDKAQNIVAITLDGYNTSYTFLTDGLSLPGAPNTFHLPKQLKKQQRRAKTRSPAPQDWELRYLDIDQVTARRNLRDVSLDGANLLGTAADENHFSSRVLTPVQIFIKDQRICSLVAELCNVTYVSGQRSVMSFGLRLRALTIENWRAWEEHVNRLIHPNTRDGRDMKDGVWDLFNKSGYFNLSDKQPGEFAAQQTAHDEFNSILNKNPELGNHTLWHGGGDIQASISTCMPYAHTALLHQMAKISGSGANRVVLRDMLIHSFEYMKNQPSLHYVAALLNAKVSFNQFAFLDFARSQIGKGLADILAFRLIEFETKSIGIVDSTITVADASTAEFAELAQRIKSIRGCIYAEAFDQTEEKLSADVAKIRWRDVGIERDRRILIARNESGKRLAAAVIDISPPGSNLFSIFDAFTVLSLEEGRSQTNRQALDALLAEAKHWFSRLGRAKFVWHSFEKDDGLVAPTYTGSTDLGLGYLWIINREVIPNLQEYWYTHMMRPRNRSKDILNTEAPPAPGSDGKKTL